MCKGNNKGAVLVPCATAEEILAKGKVTQNDIAKYVGCGRVTVTQVLNGRGTVSQEFRQRVLDAAKELGYIPRSERKKETEAKQSQHFRLMHNNCSSIEEENQYMDEWVDADWHSDQP